MTCRPSRRHTKLARWFYSAPSVEWMMLLTSTSTWTRSADACAKNTSKLHAVLSNDEMSQRDVSVAIHAGQEPFRYFVKSVNSPPYIRFSIPGESSTWLYTGVPQYTCVHYAPSSLSHTTQRQRQCKRLRRCTLSTIKRS